MNNIFIFLIILLNSYYIKLFNSCPFTNNEFNCHIKSSVSSSSSSLKYSKSSLKSSIKTSFHSHISSHYNNKNKKRETNITQLFPSISTPSSPSTTSTISSSNSSSKRSLNSLNLTNHLIQFQPQKFLQIVSNLTIYFVGDSISLQHYKSLICELSEYAEPSLLKQMEIQNLTIGKVTSLQSWSCITFIYNVSICWANDVSNRGDKYQKISEPDILIWNVAGLHSHTEIDHYTKLLRFIYYIKKHYYYPFNITSNIERLVIYRETTPQAFAGSITGDYNEREQNIQYCESPYYNQNYSFYDRNNFTTYLTYRQKLERSLLYPKNIPMLNVHDITLIRGAEQYVGFPDCSHFCNSGTPQIWNQILFDYLLNSSLISLIQRHKFNL